jgi:hypothetical protein
VPRLLAEQHEHRRAHVAAVPAAAGAARRSKTGRSEAGRRSKPRGRTPRASTAPTRIVEGWIKILVMAVLAAVLHAFHELSPFVDMFTIYRDMLAMQLVI